MLALTIDETITDAAAPTLVRDQVIQGDNGGVTFLFDIGNDYSWRGGTPVTGSTIYDLSPYKRDATFNLAGGSMSVAGGGFVFDNITARDSHIAAPASATAPLRAGAEYWMSAFYIRLPSNADWVPAGSIAPWFQFATTRYVDDNEGALIGSESSVVGVTFRRQTAAASATTITTLTPAAADKGAVVQLAFWRDATGCFGRIRSANGTIGPSGGAVGSANTADWSGEQAKWGIPGTFWSVPGTIRKIRIYRGWLESLVTSGRSAVAVLDADYTRNISRFS